MVSGCVHARHCRADRGRQGQCELRAAPHRDERCAQAVEGDSCFKQVHTVLGPVVINRVWCITVSQSVSQSLDLCWINEGKRRCAACQTTARRHAALRCGALRCGAGALRCATAGLYPLHTAALRCRRPLTTAHCCAALHYTAARLYPLHTAERSCWCSHQ